MTQDAGDILLAQQSTRWKVANSLWLAVLVLGFGCFSFVGWIWAALLAQSRVVSRAAVLWSSLGIAVFIAIGATPGTEADPYEMAEPWGTIVIVAMAVAWVGGLIHAGILWRTVLKERLLRLDRIAWAVAEHRSSQPPVPWPASPPPPPAPFLGVSAADYYGPPTSAPSPQPFAYLDINAAPADAIAFLPRIGPQVAGQIVAARTRTGGFRDLDDLATSAQLQPHQVAGIRGSVTFGPFNPQRPPQGPGRVLDI